MQTQEEITRYLWQQQLATAEATERVQDRQIRLLLLQREVLDDQLAAATAKRDQATRQAIGAQKALDELTAAI
ncbi:hypothetical protein SEA_XIMENITA_68 [Mycobacterium phage Ximenita]|uniref:Uncharacterized protein n=1 Tax=Mycobacterium phage Ximenita TaxID=2708633 RepID=A0A6G6XS90_9CAUD|nr:hypothetical protein I5G82_gp039 [Mycobacterium phage Ximenita]QIG61577.1 hypothetical protein SEA_XIMENITA_68 [Mycobacterium phage Ximenita]